MPSPRPRPSSGILLVPKISTTMTKMRSISGKPRLNMTFPPGKLCRPTPGRLLVRECPPGPGNDTANASRSARRAGNGLLHLQQAEGLVQATPTIAHGVDFDARVPRRRDRLPYGRPD